MLDTQTFVRGDAPRPQREWWSMTARRTMALIDQVGADSGVVVA
ncbi:hypothetical protein [Nocardia altamirensis]|nr:hypothetical protein [Nocardia altamirensis]